MKTYVSSLERRWRIRQYNYFAFMVGFILSLIWMALLIFNTIITALSRQQKPIDGIVGMGILFVISLMLAYFLFRYTYSSFQRPVKYMLDDSYLYIRRTRNKGREPRTFTIILVEIQEITTIKISEETFYDESDESWDSLNVPNFYGKSELENSPPLIIYARNI